MRKKKTDIAISKWWTLRLGADVAMVSATSTSPVDGAANVLEGETSVLGVNHKVRFVRVEMRKGRDGDGAFEYQDVAGGEQLGGELELLDALGIGDGRTVRLPGVEGEWLVFIYPCALRKSESGK